MSSTLKNLRGYESLGTVGVISLEILSRPFNLPSAFLAALNDADLDDGRFHFGRSSSHFISDKGNDQTGKPPNFAPFSNHYLLIAYKVIDFARDLKKYTDLYESVRDHASDLFGSKSEILGKIQSNPSLSSVISEDDRDLFAAFMDNSSKEARLGGKNPINNNKNSGVLDDREPRDIFGSVLLTQINVPNSSSNVLGILVYELISRPELIGHLKKAGDSYFEVLEEPSGDPPSSLLTPLSKPFVLLGGISGTGKTRFVREQAKRTTGSSMDNYSLVSVRPDWHEPSDLLGYVSRLGTEGAVFVPGDALRFIVKAWIEIFQSFTKINGELNWIGKPLNQIRPFWLCLDEMNLAPVEQYFADYLSVLETRKWLNVDELNDLNVEGDIVPEYHYQCDPILKADVLASLDKAGDKLMSELGLGDEDDFDKQVRDYFKAHGISIPFNLIVAGTVNMDETTHGFSRKVIDRALTYDYGEFFPNDFDEFYHPTKSPVTFTFPRISQASKPDLISSVDPEGTKSIGFLSSVNDVLSDSPFELAFRAQNELLLSVACHNPSTEAELQAVWDDFMMCKVLPRMEGDEEKLSSWGGTDSTLFDDLQSRLEDTFSEIWQEDQEREDLTRLYNDGKRISIKCRTRAKISWMKERLERNGFTSYWP